MRTLQNGSRLIIVGLMLVTGAVRGWSQNPDTTAAEKYGWGFRNFNDSLFTWDIYSHSYFGVPVDSEGTWASATFDKLFYKLVFHTTLPNPDNTQGIGNCYGISLMSLMVNKFGGYYGFCGPTQAYHGDTTLSARGPDDPALHRIINIMHGRQLSLASIETYLDQAQIGHSENANVFLGVARQTIAREGPCIISITKTLNPVSGGGHSLIAYGVTTDGSGVSKIWVVDPNRLWAVNGPGDRWWYQADSNYVLCEPGGNWKFIMSDGEVWPTSFQGHVIFVPISVAGPPGRVPSSLGLSIGDLLSKFYISGEEKRPGK